MPDVIELPGRIEAVRTAELRARVDGIVQRRFYEEGSDVAAGATLFLIDPRDRRAALQAAQGDLNRARAVRANAAAVVKRYTPLVARRAVSAQEYDAAVSDLRQADAQVTQTGATAERARLELSYTRVTAPIAGRAARAEVTEGALVSAAGATLMTRIDQLSPVYAVFSESNSAILDMQRDIQSGALRVPRLRQVEVRLVLENGAEYGPVGKLDFADLSVDPTTGGQVIRARFPNSARLLLPGQFVRGRISAGTIANGVRVPQRAVQISDKQASVLTLDRRGTATERVVQLGPLESGYWTIKSGLKPGERIVVDGWQNVQTGQKVQVRPARPAPANRPVAGPAQTPGR